VTWTGAVIPCANPSTISLDAPLSLSVQCITMGVKSNIQDNLSLFAEFWLFVRHRKRFWLLPFFVIIVVLSVFIILTESSAFAPFIYSLF
jgi:hypothetical protein